MRGARLNPEAVARRKGNSARRRMNLRWTALPYSVFAAIFILAPMLLIIFYSFFFSGNGEFSFTIEHFQRFFDLENPVYLQVIWRSVWIAVVSTVICLLIGYPIAYILSRMKPTTRGIVSFLFVLPMWMNFLLRTYAWMTLLENTGVINSILSSLNLPTHQFMYSEATVIFGNVYNFLPFMILPIYNVLIRLDASVIEASGDLGANFFQTFRRVIFPLSLGGVMSGITTTFMPALTTFIISRLLGGSKVALIGDTIESQFINTGDFGFGSALSVILMVMILAAMGIMGRYERDKNADGGMLI